MGGWEVVVNMGTPRLVSFVVGVPLWIAGAAAIANGAWPFIGLPSSVDSGVLISSIGAALIVVPVILMSDGN